MASLTRTVNRSTPAMPAHRAPAAAAASIITTIIVVPGQGGVEGQGHAGGGDRPHHHLALPAHVHQAGPGRNGHRQGGQHQRRGLDQDLPQRRGVGQRPPHVGVDIATGLAPLVSTKAPKRARAAA